MKTRIVAYGPITDFFQERHLTLSFPDTAEGVRQQIVAAMPDIADQSFSIAVDDALVSPDTRMESASEIALLPPFAGG